MSMFPSAMTLKWKTLICNFLTSWRIFDVITNFLTSWTFWHYDVLIMLWQSFWRHDKLLTSWRIFWRHNIFINVMIMLYNWYWHDCCFLLKLENVKTCVMVFGVFKPLHSRALGPSWCKPWGHLGVSLGAKLCFLKDALVLFGFREGLMCTNNCIIFIHNCFYFFYINGPIWITSF